MADSFVETLKAQVDIVKVIGEYVRLKKTGAQNYTGLCPFHKEKSGSFSVNAARGFFYCFGCHEKGDVFTFVMKLENVSFPEAVRTVAGKAGLAMPKREFGSAQEAREAGLRGQLINIHEAAAQYFEARLKSPEAARAREYLTGRGLTAAAIAKFRIGYAPDDFNEMREKMAAHFAEEVLRASGLFSWKEQAGGPMYARFRKRITFPIANEQGKVIAFTARALDSDEKSGPKYMNSPETPLYTKGNVLFNLDKAKAEMRTLDFALLVEGQMDCISVYMAGIKNVMATSGTAFTELQARLLGRFTKQVIVNFDPDTAGATAAEKSIALLTEEEFSVKVVALEGGLDPDRYIREQGVQAYMAALRGAQRYSDYVIERARLKFGTRTPEAKEKAMNFILPYIRQVPSPVRRSEFVEDAAQKLAIDSPLMRQELKQAAAQRKESVRSHVHDPVSEQAEWVLLRALVLAEDVPSRQLAVDSLTEHPDWYASTSAAILIESLANAPAPSNPLDMATTNESSGMLARILSLEVGNGDDISVAQVADALHTLEGQSLKRKQSELRVLIAETERRGDEIMLAQLTAEKMRIDRAVRQH